MFNKRAKGRAARTGSGRERVRGTEHGTTGFDSIETFNNYSDYGPREHILDEAGEEGLAGKVLVVYKERHSAQRSWASRMCEIYFGRYESVYGMMERTYAFQGAPWKG